MYTYILPYTEGGTNVDKILTSRNLDYPVTDSEAVDIAWFKGPTAEIRDTNFEVGASRFKTFLCPADDTESAADGVVVALFGFRKGYGGNSRPEDPDPRPGYTLDWQARIMTDAPALALGRTNYLGCEGYSAPSGGKPTDKNRGILGNRTVVSISHISDGTRNTILMGEAEGGSRRSDGKDYSLSWMGAGATAMAYFPFSGAVSISITQATNITQDDDEGQGFPARFNSAHTGGVQFVFGDGSVRNFNYDVSPKVVFDAAGYENDRKSTGGGMTVGF